MGKYFLKYPQSNIRVARMLRKQMTDAERSLWSHIRRCQLGVHFRRQVPVGQYVVDFLSITGKLAIELDGGQHYTNEAKQQDSIRDNYLRKLGLTVLRFDNLEVLKFVDGVLSQISDVLHVDSSDSAGKKRGGPKTKSAEMSA